MKLKKPSAGFYVLASGFVLAIVAFILSFATYDAFGYRRNLWVIAMMILSLWSMLCLLCNALLAGDRPAFMDVFYLIAAFGLGISALLFFTPCLSPIGIYFTVHNMGDVEANAVGVPRAIACIVIFVLAVICVIAASFMRLSAKRKEA